MRLRRDADRIRMEARRIGRWLPGFWVALACALGLACRGAAGPEWPPVGREQRPWAYNWWLGSAVDRGNLARELRRYAEGGLGGIHVIPIYGAKGAEARYLPYLSEAWVEMVRFAVEEGERLGIGVDMTTGTGWCFGGPDIRPELGNLGAGVLRTNMAGEAGYTLEVRQTRRKVKRAAPGGEGLMINPFSAESMLAYLAGFDRRFPAAAARGLRAMYHDSYEYFHGGKGFDAGWAPEVAAAFESRRGYRLEDHLRELGGGGDPDVATRVLADYRETLSDLMIEEVFPQWVRWSAARGLRTRNQAHGSPGNLLDLYALADIPETEMFGRGERDPLASGFDARFAEGDRDPLISKFASSAAHVAGRRLVAAETGTWLAEHFCETLEEMKCLVDLLFVSGVNHVIYHGCCYSPDDAAWPGWLFYASTQMNPRNPIWHDAPALNAYIGRCQAILQSGEPDNDILLYWPIHDLWHTPAEAAGVLDPIECGVHRREWFDGQAISATARRLWQRGWCFDYVSDRQLGSAGVSGGEIRVPGGVYRAIVVPPTRHMPVDTLRRLLALAEGGASLVFEGELPRDVPGIHERDRRREEVRQLCGGLSVGPAGAGAVRVAKLGGGQVFVGELEEALGAAGIAREGLADVGGIRFIRRRHAGGRDYFIANQGMDVFDGWVTPAGGGACATLMDPMTGSVVGAPRQAAGGSGGHRVRLDPGHSVILRTLDAVGGSGGIADARWFMAEAAAWRPVHGPWRLEFVLGGPEVPPAREMADLKSWTDMGDLATESFGGTAVYRAGFDAPGEGPWLLDLGRVRHSARVRVNGREERTLFMAPYRVLVSGLKPTGNELVVEVTNLAANRIRDMDRKKIPWRVFQDANVVSIRYKPFDASGWPPMESGLLGPVRIAPAIPAPAPPMGGRRD